jgi:hypothetical protein
LKYGTLLSISHNVTGLKDSNPKWDGFRIRPQIKMKIEMNENEILEVEMELGGGDKVQMKIQESEDWSEIEAGAKALLVLVNGQQMLVEINTADEDTGVLFKTIGNDRAYHYDADVVDSIFAEVN